MLPWPRAEWLPDPRPQAHVDGPEGDWVRQAAGVSGQRIYGRHRTLNRRLPHPPDEATKSPPA